MCHSDFFWGWKTDHPSISLTHFTACCGLEISQHGLGRSREYTLDRSQTIHFHTGDILESPVSLGTSFGGKELEQTHADVQRPLVQPWSQTPSWSLLIWDNNANHPTTAWSRKTDHNLLHHFSIHGIALFTCTC